MALKISVIIAVIANLGLVIAMDCVLSNDLIFNEKRTILFRDEGNLVPLREYSVPDGARLFFVCNDNAVENVVCRNGHLYNWNPSDCPDGMHAVLDATVPDENCPRGKINYRVGYSDVPSLYELYRVCWDQRTKSPLFTISRVYRKTVVGVERPGWFTLDTLLTGEEAKAFSMESVYNTFLQLLGPNRYIESDKDNVVERGHLAPAADFITKSHKVATNKYLNVLPEFGSINRGNWKNIETWTRNEIKSETPFGKRPRVLPRYFTVLTGGFGTLELRADGGRGMTEMYLLNPLFPIPKWIYKVVSYDGDCVVFMTYNNMRNDPITTPPRPCMATRCPENIILHSDRYNGETYCCDVRDFKRSVLPTLAWSICKVV